VSRSPLLRVYEALVLSVLIYAAETSGCNRHESVRGLPHEMSVSLCQILEIRWSDFVSNVDVQARTGLTPLREILASQIAFRFSPRDYAVARCPAVRPSVCLSVTRRYCV